MAKRSKRGSSRPYDDDDYNDNDDMMDEVEDEEEDFEDDDDVDEDGDSDEMEDDFEEEEAPKAKRASKKKAVSPRKRATDANANKEVRLKAFWSVYSQNFQRVETFEYGEKEAAEQRAAELTESRKMLHFVKLDKKVIES